MKALTDGDFYSFKYGGVVYSGYYDADSHCFIDNLYNSYPAGSCTQVRRI